MTDHLDRLAEMVALVERQRTGMAPPKARSEARGRLARAVQHVQAELVAVALAARRHDQTRALTEDEIDAAADVARALIALDAKLAEVLGTDGGET